MESLLQPDSPMATAGCRKILNDGLGSISAGGYLPPRVRHSLPTDDYAVSEALHSFWVDVRTVRVHTASAQIPDASPSAGRECVMSCDHDHDRGRC